MEPYLLTQDDINTLVEKGFDMNGVAAGSEAVASEVEALNLGIPTQSFDEVPVPAGELPVNVPSSTPAPAPAQVTPVAAPAQGVNRDQILAALTSQAAPAAPADPFANLSKTQRRMMAFAGIADAGAALQGVKGGNVNALMGRFNEVQDMERKRQAAAANQQMMARLIGPEGSLAAGGMKTAEDYRNAAANLARQMAMMGPAGQNLIPLIQRYEAEAKRLSGIELGETSSVQSAADAFETVADLRRTVEDEDGVTGFWGMMLSKLPWSKAAEVRIDADTLRSNMALDALKALKAQNATLGSVSEAELKLLESEIAQLNFNQKKSAVLKDLKKIEKRYQRAIQSAYANTSQPEKLDKIMESVFGSVPEWSKGSFEQYTFENVPQGEIAFDNGVAYVYRGGDRTDESSWEELK